MPHLKSIFGIEKFFSYNRKRNALGLAFTFNCFLALIADAAEINPGKELFLNKGCIACHKIGKEGLLSRGGVLGPALDTVGDRYTPEWIYEWIRNPSAVKPGTKMPTLELTDNERAYLSFYLSSLRLGKNDSPLGNVGNRVLNQPAELNTHAPDRSPESPENSYLNLGVEESYADVQRYTLQDQIQSFIPPLYEPALTQSAFVLPPGAFRTSVAYRDVATMDENDVSGQMETGGRFNDFELERGFLDFDMFVGLDNNFTVRVNIPVTTSNLSANLSPAFFDPVSVFPTGSSLEIGDVSVFLKKRFFDQGNFPISLAGVGALRLPTGSNEEKFNSRTTANIAGTNMLLPLPAANEAGMPVPGTMDGTFRRFSDDGRLPAPLQPGLGVVGGSFGLFATRQFEGNTSFGRGAFHTGALYEIRPGNSGFDPGNNLTYFASLVKPLWRESVSLDLTYLLKDQEDDSYAGKMFIPTGTGPMAVNRPSFSGGTTQFIGTSLIITPNPQIRFILNGLINVGEPRLGPSPDYVFRVAVQYTFASGLYKKRK